MNNNLQSNSARLFFDGDLNLEDFLSKCENKALELISDGEINKGPHHIDFEFISLNRMLYDILAYCDEINDAAGELYEVEKIKSIINYTCKFKNIIINLLENDRIINLLKGSLEAENVIDVYKKDLNLGEKFNTLSHIKLIDILWKVEDWSKFLFRYKNFYVKKYGVNNENIIKILGTISCDLLDVKSEIEYIMIEKRVNKFIKIEDTKTLARFSLNPLPELYEKLDNLEEGDRRIIIIKKRAKLCIDKIESNQEKKKRHEKFFGKF